MPLYRFQIAQGADSAFPADRIVNTVHFDDAGVGSDPQQLCQDILDAWQANWLSATAREIRVTAYNVGPPPQYPVASVIENEGVFPATTQNREIALCLSYYNQRSNPRRRGRIYLCPAISVGQATGARPAAGVMTAALNLGEALAGIGGIDVDWVLYSRRDASHHDVVGCWVDDAWDVVRSRGLRPVTRVERATGS